MNGYMQTGIDKHILIPRYILHTHKNIFTDTCTYTENIIFKPRHKQGLKVGEREWEWEIQKRVERIVRKKKNRWRRKLLFCWARKIWVDRCYHRLLLLEVQLLREWLIHLQRSDDVRGNGESRISLTGWKKNNLILDQFGSNLPPRRIFPPLTPSTSRRGRRREEANRWHVIRGKSLLREVRLVPIHLLHLVEPRGVDSRRIKQSLWTRASLSWHEVNSRLLPIVSPD